MIVIHTYPYVVNFLRKGPDTVRSLSACQQAQNPSPIASNELKIKSIERDSYPLWSRWPAKRFLTVSGPFPDFKALSHIRLNLT